MLALVIGPRMWSLASDRGYVTVGPFWTVWESVRVAIASLIWIGALFILAGQLLPGAGVFTAVAGLPHWAGVLIGGAAMTGYFSAGGLLSSAGVSIVQLVVKFTGFAIAIPILMKAAAGSTRSRTRRESRTRSSIPSSPPARDPASRCS